MISLLLKLFFFLPEKNLSSIVSNNLQIFVLSITLLFPILNFFVLFDIIAKEFKFKNHIEDFHLIILIASQRTLVLKKFVTNTQSFQFATKGNEKEPVGPHTSNKATHLDPAALPRLYKLDLF